MLERIKVLVSSVNEERGLVWEMLRNGVSVDLEVPGRKRCPAAALLFVVPHCRQTRDVGEA